LRAADGGQLLPAQRVCLSARRLSRAAGIRQVSDNPLYGANALVRIGGVGPKVAATTNDPQCNHLIFHANGILMTYNRWLAAGSTSE
jgi:hypothetical protein